MVPARLLRWGLLALTLTLLAAAQAPAWCTLPPVKVNAKFDVQFNVKVGVPTSPTLPWYAYFPYDPHLMGPQGSMYPGWPQPFPPPGPKQPEMGPAPRPTLQVQMPPQPPPRFVSWPGAYQTHEPPLANPNVQQTSFVPSYWYGR
jgi:hypothetical protein